MSMAPITALLTLKKIKHVVSGTNRRIHVICSIDCILMSSIVCPGKLKCRAMKVFACFLMEER